MVKSKIADLENGFESVAKSSQSSSFSRLEDALEKLPSAGLKKAWVILTVLLFLLLINDSWNASPDSALYLSLGESLSSGKGYVFNGAPHTFVPPGFPLILAGINKCCGANFFCYRTAMALMGLLSAAAAYFFLRKLAGPRSAFFGGGLFAVSHTLVQNATFVLADVPFALFTIIALIVIFDAGSDQGSLGRIIAAGLLTGILPLIRINGLAVPVAAAFYFTVSGREQAWSRRATNIGFFLALSYLPTLVWQIWKASFPVSASEGTYFSAVAERRWEDQIQIILTAFWSYFPETTYALTGLNIRTGVLEFILPLVVIWGMYQAASSGDRLIVPLTVIQFCGLLLSTAGDRYLLFLLPFMYIFMGLGIADILGRLPQRLTSSLRPRKMLVGCWIFFALTNLGHDLMPLYQARTALEANGAESERTLPYFIAARWLKLNAPDSVVLTTRSRIIYYLSGCPTVALVRSGVPDHEAWVNGKQRIQTLIQESKPNYVFVDNKDSDLYSEVFKAISDLGLRYKEIPEAGYPPRYKLFKIVND